MNRPIRITHVITDLDTGGAEMMLYRLLSRLDKNKVLSNVVSLTDEGPIGPQISRLGIEVRSLGMNAGSINPYGIIKLASILKENQTDLVQTWMYHSDFIGGLAALAAGIKPVIWGIHNSTLDPQKSKARTRLIVRINSYLSRFVPHTIIACSQAALDVHLKIGFNKERMQFIPNGFDLSEFRPDDRAKNSIRKELGISQNSLVAGMAARFDPQKDHQNFFSAGSILLKQFPDLHLVLCGDGINKDNPDLMRLVSPLNSDGRIHLLGRRTDIPALTASWDLAILSSGYGEAFPLVIGEAMACGVPCVVTNVGDSAAMVADSGRIVPPRDPMKLAAAAAEILNLSPADRLILGNRARERILTNFDLGITVEKYSAVYLKAVGAVEGTWLSKEPLHVTHVITDLETGGAEMMLFKLLRGLDRRLISPEVVSLSEIGPIGQKIMDLGIKVTSLGMKAGSLNPSGIFKLASSLKASHTDLVQTWMYHADLIGGLAALFAGRVPTLWNIRNSTLDRETSKLRTRIIVRLNASLSRWLPEKVLVCSNRAQEIHEDLGYVNEKMIMVPNGFNLNEFHPDSTARKWLLKELNLPEVIRLVGLVARFDPQKDIHSFIMAAKSVRATLPNVHFILCGDRMGPENHELTDWLDNEGLREQFHLLGRRDDMQRVTAGFDLAVSSSAYGEAFSNVIGEAMACGIPCVATDVGDSAAIIADTGLVVPPRDPQKLADAIINLMRRPDSERKTLGSAARERIQSNYDLKAVIEAYTRIYQEVFK